MRMIDEEQESKCIGCEDFQKERNTFGSRKIYHLYLFAFPPKSNVYCVI